MPLRTSDSLAPGSIVVLLAALVVFGFASASHAQSPSPPSDRTHPGFNVVDSSPMSIEHIDPLYAASITLFSTLRKDDLLPRDMGVELLPWLPTSKSAPLPINEQIALLKNLTRRQAIGRYVGFSVALSQDVATADSPEPASQVIFGARTFLAAGALNRELQFLMADYLAATEELDRVEARLRGSPDASTARKDEIQLAQLLLRSRDLIRRMALAPKNRVGFLLEVGGGTVLQTRENDVDTAKPTRHAFWLTPMYRHQPKPIDVAGLIRVIVEPQASVRLLDLGVRVAGRRRGVYYSAEGIFRHRLSGERPGDDDPRHSRGVGAIAYPLNRSTHLHFTIGKNFSKDFSGGGSILASFGLTMGLGQLPLSTMADGQER